MGLRALRVLNDDRVKPGAGFGSHGHRDMEIFSYVLEGGLAHQDSTGGGGVIRPGEIQFMRAGTGVTHSERNASQSEPVHFLRQLHHATGRLRTAGHAVEFDGGVSPHQRALAHHSLALVVHEAGAEASRRGIIPYSRADSRYPFSIAKEPIMKALIVLALLTTAASIEPPTQQSEGERDILNLTNEYEDGIRRRDASVHQRLFAEDYTYTPGNGNFMKRAGHMAFAASGVTTVESLRSEDKLVRVYGDTAVVTGRWVFTGSRGARAVTEQRIRYLLVFVKREGRWQIVAEQRTGAPSDPKIGEE